MGDAKVLIVDDEKDFSSALADRMTTRGLDVDTVDSGEEAVNRVKDRGYDAVVLDLAMPGMDGIETLKQLLKQNPDLQVILLTGRATVEKGVEAVQEGAVEFLEKPANIDMLMEKIEKAKTRKIMLFEKRLEDTMSDIMKKKGW
jgi:DNA-binding NtrC family response regulator